MKMRTLIAVMILSVLVEYQLAAQVTQVPVQGVATAIQPIVEQLEFGPVLDVIPYVSADGYTVQMTIIPTVKEFVEYDLQSAALFSATAQSVGAGVGNALTATQPFPVFRLRQVVTSAIVW